MWARSGELDGLFAKTYEDNACSKLSDERFMMITKRYDDEQLDIYYNFIGILDTPEVAARPTSVTLDTRQGLAVNYFTRKAG